MDNQASEDIFEGHDDNEVHNSNTIEASVPEKLKLIKLPLSRVKTIMKMDPDCNIVSQDATFIVCKATELFIEMLSKGTYEYTTQTKRKTVMKQDLDKLINSSSNLCFLDGMLD